MTKKRIKKEDLVCNEQKSRFENNNCFCWKNEGESKFQVKGAMNRGKHIQ